MNLIFLLNFSCQQNVIKIIWNCVRCDKKNMKRYGTPLYCDIHSFDINNKLIWYFSFTMLCLTGYSTISQTTNYRPAICWFFVVVGFFYVVTIFKRIFWLNTSTFNLFENFQTVITLLISQHTIYPMKQIGKCRQRKICVLWSI